MDSEQAYRSYRHELVAYGNSLVGPLDAAQVVTEACVRAFSSPDWPQIGNQRSFLYRMVFAVAYDSYPDALSRRLNEMGDADPLTAGSYGAIRAFEGLSIEERATIHLVYGVRAKPGEVAAQLGVSTPTARRLLTNARAKLGIGEGSEASDLLSRVAALSPTPPEFPRWTAEMRPVGSRSPKVITWVAAAGIVALILPLLFLGGGQSAIEVTTTIPQGPPPGAVTFSGVIYLVQDPVNGVNERPAIVPFEVVAFDQTGLLADDEDDVTFLSKLTDLDVVLPSNATGPEDTPDVVFYSMIPSGTRVEGMSTVEWRGNQVLVLDMYPDFSDGAGDEIADVTMINQLIYTATHDDPGQLVWFAIEGNPVQNFGVADLDLSLPVGRDTFRDQLNPIFLTAPVVVDIESQTVTIDGMANVSDGEVSYQVATPEQGLSTTGESATGCSDGCWGGFGFSLPAADMVAGGAIEIFETAAQDGSQTNLIKIFMPAGFDGRWNLSSR